MENESKQLTASDPIGKEVLLALETISATQQQVAIEAMEYERERISCVRKYNALETEKVRLIERALVERGLPPSTGVTIDPVSGALTIEGAQEPPPAAG